MVFVSLLWVVVVEKGRWWVYRFSFFYKYWAIYIWTNVTKRDRGRGWVEGCSGKGVDWCWYVDMVFVLLLWEVLVVVSESLSLRRDDGGVVHAIGR